MKNFKLLLATTAILSTGAIVAQAIDERNFTTNINISADIVSPEHLAKVQDLNFGRIAIQNGGTLGTITITTDGQVQNDNTLYFEGAQQGIVKWNGSIWNIQNRTLSFPEEVTLTDTSSNECGTVSNFQSGSSGRNACGGAPCVDEFGIGATFSFDSQQERLCTGTLTISLIATPEP